MEDGDFFDDAQDYSRYDDALDWPMDLEPIQFSGFVSVGKMDAKTQMYVRIFMAGPPEGCVPWLN